MANDSVARALAVAALNGGGGGEPEAYLKTASVNGNTLTITDKNDSQIVFSPEGEPELYLKNASVSGNVLTLTKEDDSTVTFTDTDTTYTAGNNVSISNNVISATDTTYSAGTGISISNNVISSNVPKLTFTLAQVVSQDPIIIQFTAEQKAILEVEQNMCFEFDLTQLGMSKNYWTKVYNISGGNIILDNSQVDNFTRGRIFYNIDTKQATYETDINVVKAGTNITVNSVNGEISATDTTYSAGTGINISSNVVSYQGTTLWATYDSGTGTLSLSTTAP